MEQKQIVREIGTQTRALFPLFRYLVLQTETHAFCLALACAALIGFYPFCFLILSLTKNTLHWDGAYNVTLAALYEYYPTEPEFLIRNLKLSIASSGRTLQMHTVFWILLGAAGVFIPLEAGLNRLWKVPHDRPYWHNQLVGLSLTVICVALALVFVGLTAVFQSVADFIMPITFMRRFSDYIILKATAVSFFSIAILLFYKLLPNRKIDTLQVLPAAILAGMVAEIVKDVYVAILPLMDIGSSQGSQGPFYISVSFVVLAYFETFVVLGGAFLATQTDAYPWMGIIRRRKKADGSEIPTVIR